MTPLSIKAVESLTPKQRQVWSFVMQEGYSQYRTADLLCISRNAVKDRLDKAKKQFRKFIVERTRIEQNKKRSS